MNDEDRKAEETDREPFEGDPDFEVSPTHQVKGDDVQDADEIDPDQGGQVETEPPGIEGLVHESTPNVPGAPTAPPSSRVPGTPRA